MGKCLCSSPPSVQQDTDSPKIYLRFRTIFKPIQKSMTVHYFHCFTDQFKYLFQSDTPAGQLALG